MILRARAHYRTVDNQTSVNGRTPAELILLVYDRVLEKLTEAELAIASGEWRAMNEALQQSADLISQGLMAALDFEIGGDIAANLGQIYDFALRRLLQARLLKDVVVVREVHAVLAGLREAWTFMPQIGRTA